MAKDKPKILKRLPGLIPDVDAICIAYGVDQRRAKRIQDGLIHLLDFVGDLVSEQAELIEGQADTAKLIARQVGKEKDALTIIMNMDVFLSGDTATVEYILSIVFTETFAEAFGKLESDRQIELFASLRKAINSLEKKEGLLIV